MFRTAVWRKTQNSWFWHYVSKTIYLCSRKVALTVFTEISSTSFFMEIKCSYNQRNLVGTEKMLFCEICASSESLMKPDHWKRLGYFLTALKSFKTPKELHHCLTTLKSLILKKAHHHCLKVFNAEKGLFPRTLKVFNIEKGLHHFHETLEGFNFEKWFHHILMTLKFFKIAIL